MNGNEGNIQICNHAQGIKPVKHHGWQPSLHIRSNVTTQTKWHNLRLPNVRRRTTNRQRLHHIPTIQRRSKRMTRSKKQSLELWLRTKAIGSDFIEDITKQEVEHCIKGAASSRKQDEHGIYRCTIVDAVCNYRLQEWHQLPECMYIRFEEMKK